MTMDATLYSVSATADFISYDDYVGVVSGYVDLEEFSFIGGVANANEILWFDFYHESWNLVDYFGAQFSQGGNWIWTLTLSSPISIPNSGYVEVWADSYYGTSTGTWYLNADWPTVGYTDPTIPGYEAGGYWLDHKFELVGTAGEPFGLAATTPAVARC